jgi:alkylation response protein AidB-like acyl-CoA dehydrogenase
MRVTPLLSIGNDKLCEVVLEETQVSQSNILGAPGKGEEILRNVKDWGALAYSAFIAGMLEKVLSMAIKYAKEREQFGKLIGSFQAIQHQCADMATEVDKVKLLTYHAAWKLSNQMPATKEIAMAKARASDASRHVGLYAIKVHGGIGIMEEYDLQLYFRRLKASELAFGDGDFQREIVARELGL